MRKAAAIILSVTALVLFSGDAQARRLSLSFVRSVPKSVAPISKPVAAPSAPAGCGPRPQPRDATHLSCPPNPRQWVRGRCR